MSKATNLPSVKQTVQGIDFSIEDAQIYKEGGKTILELSLVFAATSPCPLTGGAVCGVNQYGIQGTDNEGFKLTTPLLTSPETIKASILRQGEKTKGKYFFILSDVSSKYFVTYGAPSGEQSNKIEIDFK